MLSRRDYNILLSIINRCNRIEEKINNVELSEFVSSKDLEEIISFNIFQIGEIVKKLSNDFLIKHPDISWKKIMGMRDVIGHGYDTVDFNIVWNTSISDISILKTYCNEIILLEEVETE